MDEFTKQWFFYSWIENKEEKVKFMKDLGCFIGSFYNQDMAQKIRDMDNSKKYDSGEEGFEMATKLIGDSIKNNKTKPKSVRKRRKKISIR